MNDARNKVFAFIDGAQDIAIELEREMCARPAISPESGGEGEAEKAAYLEKYLQKAFDGAKIERFDAPDSRAKGGTRPNLVFTLDGKDSAHSIWVISHLDVVPEGDLSLWNAPPWELQVKGNCLTGRGAEDNQQGICSSIIAALALAKNGVVPSRNIKLLFAADEEVGSTYGIGYLMEKCAHIFKKGDAAIIPDAGSADGAEIEIAEKNLLWLKVSVEGKQTHGSRPNTGVNAHYAHAVLVTEFHALYEKFAAKDALFDPPYSTFEPTKIEPNVPNVNTIPGSAVFYLDCRVLPRYPLKDITTAFAEIAAQVEKKLGVRVKLEPCQMQESPATSVESPLYTALSRCIKEVLRVDAKSIGIGGGTVAAYLRRAGVDSAVWGKLAEQAHQANETALLSNILDEAKVLAAFFMDATI